MQNDRPKPVDTERAPTAETRPPHRTGRRWLWIFLIVVILLAAGGVFLFRPHTKPASTGKAAGGAPPPLMISTATAQKGNIGVYVNALGLVTPVNTVAVRSRVDGQLLKVEYVEGQTVKQGDPLVEIDPAPFQAALAQYEGQLARDEALLENARLDLDRYKEAFAKNAIARQQLETQRSTVHQYEGTVKLDQGQIDN